MSRIHEALRKAEQERAERAPVDVPSLLEATPVEAPHPIPAPAAFQGTPGPPLLVPEAPLLERLRERCAKPDWKPDPRSIVFTNDSQAPLAAEQFRTLRTRLYQFREKHPCRRLLITSSLPAEGKTFVASNLAHAIVRQHERHVLLIDTDLRASRLHLALGAPSEPGLSEYLRGDADEFDVIQSSPEGNLFFIPAGKVTANPAELLAGPRLKSMLDRMAPLFDWIVLDSPPALPVADAGLLAGLCDGVLLVVKSGSTPYDAAKKACMEFQEKNLIGAVINRAEEIGSYSSYYYYYGSDGK
jgi:protein-tyrosine kinase